MNAPRLISAPAYGALAAPLIEFLRRETARTQVLIIAGERAAADELARRACEGVLAGVHRYSLDQLAAELARRWLGNSGTSPVSAVASEALAARSTDLALRAERLQYFSPVARMPGFASALARTIRELRLERVSAGALRASGAAGGDLAELLQIYERELAERSLADLAIRFQLATEVVHEGKHHLSHLPLVLLEVQPRSRSERELLDAIVAQSPAVLAGSLDANASGTDRFLAIALPWDTSTCLEAAQRYLFSVEPVPQRPADETVDIFSASGEALECVEIARRIGQQAARGVVFDRIAVLLRHPEHYQPVVEEALRRAAIPGWYSSGTRRPHPSGRAFLALLQCANEGLSAGRFAEYLALGQLPDRERERAPAGWERLVLDAAVIGGKDRWERRLRGLSESLRTARSAAEDDAAREFYSHRMEALEELSGFALPVIALLGDLPAESSWADWLNRLDHLASATLRFPSDVQDLLDELSPMAEIGPVSLDEVLLILSDRLRFLREPSETSRYGKVFVGAIEEARGMDFELVFIPGMCEGNFPRPVTEDPLLLNQYRRNLGAGLREATDDSERDCLRVAVAAARNGLVLSYPRVDLLTGRARVPSLYVFEVAKAARGAFIDIRQIEDEARGGAQTRIGWPAPDNPDNAIDDAEFDLATLRPAFQSNDGKGLGAYLTGLSKPLVRSLRARGRRWRPKWFSADGLVDLDIETLQVLERYRPGKKAYSATSLEQYAACPYRFALRVIHQLHPAQAPVPLQRMDPLIRGDIHHRVQFALLNELRAEGLLPVDAARLDEIFLRLDRVLEAVAGECAEKLAPAIPYVWESDVENLRADLRGWLHQMSDARGWTPVHFELAFGGSAQRESDPASSSDPVTILDGMLLRGSIDLVERHTSGTLRVTDHKTGRPPSPIPRHTGFGEVLQPLLYSLAAEQLLEGKVLGGRLNYSTIRGNYKVIEFALMEFSRRKIAEVLHVIDQSIYQGFLPAAPRKDACKTCDYLPICGPYEEERVHRKAQTELSELRQLRSQA